MAKYTQEQFDQFMKDNDEVLTLAQDAGIGIEQLKDGALNMSAFEPSMGEAVSAGGKAAVAGLKKQAYGLGRAAVEGALDEDKPVEFMGKEYQPKEISGASLGDVIKDLVGEDVLKNIQAKLQTDDANVSKKLADEMPYIEDPDSFKATVIDAIGGVLPSATTGLIAGLLTRSPQLAASVVGAGSYGSYYGQSRDKGLTPEQSRERAARFAAMESAGEVVPLASALGKLGAKGILGRVGTSAVTEGVQEGVTDVAQAVHDNVAYGDAIPEDLMQQAWRSAKAGALGGGVLGGGGYVLDKTVPNLSEQPKEARGDVNPESVDIASPEQELTEEASVDMPIDVSNNVGVGNITHPNNVPENEVEPVPVNDATESVGETEQVQQEENQQEPVKEQVDTASYVDELKQRSNSSKLKGRDIGKVKTQVKRIDDEISSLEQDKKDEVANFWSQAGVTKGDERKQQEEQVAEIESEYDSKIQALSQQRDDLFSKVEQHKESVAASKELSKIKAMPESKLQSYVENKRSQETAASEEKAQVEDIDAAANEAATSPTNDIKEPTQSQKEAGNYKHGHVNLKGLDIAIENPKGSVRSGTDENGNEWSVDMKNHYGRIKKTNGADNEQVDVFIGDNPSSDKIYVVNQNNPNTGEFDEHKVMMGFKNEKQAVNAYNSNYSKDWKGFDSVTEMTPDEFKSWLKNGDTKRPAKMKTKGSSSGKKSVTPRKKLTDDEVISLVGDAKSKQARILTIADKGYNKGDAIAINNSYEKLMDKKLSEKRSKESVPTKTTRQEPQSDKSKGGDFKSAIESTKSGNDMNAWMRDNASNKTYREIAKRIPRLLSNSLEIVPVKKGEYAPVNMRRSKGVYSKDGNKEKIYLWNDPTLSDDKNADETTLMHELVHAATAQAIRVGKKKPDSSLGKAVKELEDLHKDIVNDVRWRSANDQLTELEKSKAGKRVRNVGFNNVDELVAWGLTDKDAQEILKGIKVTPTKTAWSKFVSIIGKMLGLKPTDNSALSRLLETTDKIMTASEADAKVDKVKLSQEADISRGLNAVSEEDAQAVRDKFNPNPEKLAPHEELLEKAKAASPSKAKTLVARVKSEMRRGMIDKYEPIKNLEDKMYADGSLTDVTSSAWRMANTIHASHGVMSVLFDYGKVHYDKNNKVIVPSSANEGGLKKVLSQLNEPNELDDFFMWIASNRANEINQRSKSALNKIVEIRKTKRDLRDKLSKTNSKLEQGRILKQLKESDAQISALKKKAKVKERFLDEETIRNGMLLDTLSRKDGKSREALFDKVLDEFNSYRESVLRVAEETGIISSENREMWSDQFYVPFYRVMENDTKIGPHPTPGLSRQDAIKKLKGSQKQLGDLLDNTLMNFNFLIDASLRNRAAAQAIENAELAGIAHKTTEHKKSDQATYVMENGKKEWYNIDDPAYFAAVTATGMTKMPFQDNPIMKLANKSKVAFTKLTTIVPKFSLAMIVKDAILAPALGKVGMAKGGALRGAYKYGMGGISDVKAEMLTTGASFDLGYDAQDRKKELDKEFKKYKGKVVPIQYALGALKGMANYYGDFQNMAENANRSAIYMAAKEDGKSRLDAAFESADMQNFSQSGAWPTIRFLNGIVPFLNVGLQGIDKTMRSFGNVYKVANGMADADTKNKATRFLTVTSVLSAATIALALSNSDDDEYKELPDYMRNTYWFIRYGDRKGEYFLIPKPFSIGSVINVSEKITDNVTGVAKADSTLEYIRDVALQTLNINPVPQLAKPWVEMYMNKDMFTGQPIENSRDLRYSPEQRYDYKTSELAKFFGNEKLSPKQIDHLLKAYFSSGGESISEAINLTVNAFSDNPMPKKYWYERSVFSRFYSDRTAPTFTKSQQRFYDVYGEFIEAKNDYKRAMDMGDEIEAANIIKAKGYKVQLAPMLDKYKRKISKVTKSIESVRNNKLLSAEEKRKQIDMYNALKGNMYKEVMDAVDQVMDSIPK